MASLSQAQQLRLAEDYRREQSRLKQTKQKLIIHCELLQNRITQELQKLQQTSHLINHSAQSQTKLYHDSLNSDEYSKDVIDLNTLSTYLKREKAHLTDIVACSQQLNTKPKSGTELLHKLSNNKKMQKHLQQLQCLKLQKQIEYLQKNILVGKSIDNKQTIAYEDIQSVTLKQEKQQIQKVRQSIEELERLIGLSNECGGNVNSELGTKVSALNAQSERLQIVVGVLQRETRNVVQVKEFFVDYQPQQIAGFLSQSLQTCSVKQFDKQNQTLNQQAEITQEDLDFLLNFNPPPLSTQIFKQPYQEVNDLIKICKTKLKKIKS